MTRFRLTPIVAGSLAIGALHAGARSDTCPPTAMAQLVVPHAASGDRVGTAIAIDAGRVALGAPLDDTTGPNAGSVTILSLDGEPLHTLFAPTGGSQSRFGSAIAFDQHVLLVGASNRVNGATGAGVVHAYDATSFEPLGTIESPAPMVDERFGGSIALDWPHALIGASGRSDGAGAAYLVDIETGAVLHTFEPPASAGIARFGIDVAMDAERVVVGAFTATTGTLRSGAVYVFDRSSGTLLGAPAPPDLALDDGFGRSVDIADGRIVAGAFRTDDGGLDAGSAHVFDANTLTHQHTLRAPDPQATAWFGLDACIAGELALVAAPRMHAGAFESGTVFLFDLTDPGAAGTMLAPPDPQAEAQYGFAIDFAGTELVVGSHRRDRAGASDVGMGDRWSIECAPGSADLDGDGAVDGNDLAALLSNWGECSAPAACAADLDRDGVVDGRDLILLLGAFGA